jgi:hypothetical protein
MNQENCKWCGIELTGEYEEIFDEDENEDGTFTEVYNLVCKECLDREMS